MYDICMYYLYRIYLSYDLYIFVSVCPSSKKIFIKNNASYWYIYRSETSYLQT